MKTARRILLTVLALVVLLAGGGFAWSAWTERPQGTPQAVELDHARISDRLASATVLAFGEATHGTHEFRAAFLTVAQQLADRGFTTIALEEDAGSVSRVDAWVQGGPGTVEDALAAFGFRLSRTQEMAELLTWARAHNEGRPDAERIRLHGIDFQRPEADRAVALAWLAEHDPAAATRLETDLAAMDDDSHYDPTRSEAFRPAADELARVVEAAAGDATDDATVRAVLAAKTLARGAERGASGLQSHARDRLMADQLADLVTLRARQGGDHTLLFAHNGHVDRTPQASLVLGTNLGQHAARMWGDGYRVIGTDARHVALLDGGRTHGFTVNSRVRGLFAGTSVGYLEFADATEENRAVLDATFPAPSAGSPFAAWQAWVPFFHEVRTTPAQAFDALIYVDRTTPVTAAG